MQPITHIITPGRAADGSEEQRERDIRRLVHDGPDELEAVSASGLGSARLVDVAIHGARRTGSLVRLPDAAAIDRDTAAILRRPDA